MKGNNAEFEDTNLRPFDESINIKILNNRVRESPHVKPLSFIDKFKDKENHAIKAYNHVHNRGFKPLVDSPQTVNFIIEAMKQCEQSGNASQNHSRMASMEKYSCKNTPRGSPKQQTERQFYTHRYKIDTERRDLNRLNEWLIHKLEEQKKSQKTGASLITQRIHSLHMVYSQACRHVAKYSQPLAQTLVTVHSQYHEMYEFLVDFLMKQNKTLKRTQISLQQKTNNLINHYEKQLLSIRAEYEKKSSKIIDNFHKCIIIKQQMEEENKKLSNDLKITKKKLAYIQQGFAKSINILLDIGNQKFKFLTSDQEKAILQICEDFNKCPENYKLFHRWCSTVIHIILQMSDQSKKSADKKEDDYLKNLALSSIGKFMLDFDPSLSLKDIEDILFNYVPTYSPKFMKFEQQAKKIQQHKIQKIYEKKVPNLQQISQTFKGTSVQIQTGILLDFQSKSIQAVPEFSQKSTQIKPLQKTKQTSTVVWMKEKLSATRIYSQFIWAQKICIEQKKIKKEQTNLVNKKQQIVTKLKTSVANEKLSHIRKSSRQLSSKLKNQKDHTKKKVQIIQQKKVQRQNITPSIKIIPDNNEENLSAMGSTANKQMLSQFIQLNSQFQSSNQFSKKRVNHSRKNRRNGRSVKFEDAEDQNMREQLRSSLAKAAYLQKITEHDDINEKNDQIQKLTSSQKLKTKQTKTLTFINLTIQQNQLGNSQTVVCESIKNLQRRRGAISKNINKFVSDIVQRRSMKNITQKSNNIYENQNKQRYINKENILMNLIKVPKKIIRDKNSLKTFQIQPHLFSIELIETLQQKNKIMTESTMWNHKKNLQMQKIIQKIIYTKEKVSPNSSNLEILLQQIKKTMEPIFISYLKMYSSCVEKDNILSTNQLKKQLLTGKSLGYYHRLAPFMKLVLSSYLGFGVGKGTKMCSIMYKSLKVFKNFEPKLQMYEQLLDGGFIELDIYIKIVYYLSDGKNFDIFCQSIPLKIVQLKLYFILEIYLNPIQINVLISSLRTMKKDDTNNRKSGDLEQKNNDQIVNLGQIALKFFKTLKHKKNALQKKYKDLMKYFSGDKNVVTFHDLVYICEVLPIDKRMKHKILFVSSFYLNYWCQKQPSLPISILLFVFDSIGIQQLKLKDQEKTTKNMIHEYFKQKCENEYTRILEKITMRPQYVIQTLYKLFYKVPPIIYRVTEDIKMAKNKYQNIVLLTILYTMIIEEEVEKIYMPSLLNALISIPLPY